MEKSIPSIYKSEDEYNEIDEKTNQDLIENYAKHPYAKKLLASVMPLSIL
ncbi:hypothetical protein [Peribacillus frigoritolerans]